MTNKPETFTVDDLVQATEYIIKNGSRPPDCDAIFRDCVVEYIRKLQLLREAQKDEANREENNIQHAIEQEQSDP